MCSVFLLSGLVYDVCQGELDSIEFHKLDSARSIRAPGTLIPRIGRTHDLLRNYRTNHFRDPGSLLHCNRYLRLRDFVHACCPEWHVAKGRRLRLVGVLAMKDEKFLTALIAVAVFLIGMLVGSIAGFQEAKASMRKEAVKAGIAEWRSDPETGGTVFVYLTREGV